MQRVTELSHTGAWPTDGRKVSAYFETSLISGANDMRNTSTMACALAMACTAAMASASTHAVITNASSRENITHLAPGLYGGSMPGGANAARFLDVTAMVFQADGTTPAPGVSVTFEAFDGDASAERRTPLATTVAVANSQGVARTRLDIGVCRGPGIVGPVTARRPSNRPAWWSITYVPGAIVRARTSPDTTVREANFQHVCREQYLGARP